MTLYLQSVFVVLYLQSVFVVFAICVCCTLFAICVCCTLFALCICCICNMCLLYFIRAYFYTQTHDIASFDPLLNGCVFSFIFLTDYTCTNCFLNQSLTQYSSDINIHCHYISTFIILHSSSKNKTHFLTQTSPPILLFIVLWHVYPTR